MSSTEIASHQGAWNRVIQRLALACGSVGALALALMCLTVVVDVSARITVNSGVTGTLDLVSFWWMPLVAVLPLALVNIQNRHLNAGLIAEGLSAPARRHVSIITSSLSAIVLAGLTGYSMISAVASSVLDERATVIRWLPVWPLRYVVVFGLLVATLQMITDVAQWIRNSHPLNVIEPEDAAGGVL